MAVPPFDRRALPAELTVDHLPMPDGWRIRRMRWPAAAGEARGSLLFLGGRSDFGEKYLEAMAHWRLLGWDITSFDWRGQGGSAGDGPMETDFDLLLDDLAGIVAGWSGGGAKPHVCVAHSMGGHLALRLIAERGWQPEAIALAAPMIGIASGPIPSRAAGWIARVMCVLGFGGAGLWRSRGLAAPLRQSTLTGSPERYADEEWWVARHPYFAARPPRWRWIDAAYRSIGRLAAAHLEGVTAPVLMLAAGRERLVSNAAIERAVRRLPRARLVTFEGAAHELLREADPVRDRVLAAIDDFLDETARP